MNCLRIVPGSQPAMGASGFYCCRRWKRRLLPSDIKGGMGVLHLQKESGS